MSDDKRQTRLLPFRLRRAGAKRPGAGLDGAEDFSADPELTALLREWEAPPQTLAARERLLADFRAEFGRAPLWRRALTARVRVPLPVAACAALALLLSLVALGSRSWTQAAPAALESGAAAVRVVEVPVIQERVVTRTVYVEKKERDAARGVSSQTNERESLAAGGAATGRAATAQQQKEPARNAAATAGYFTRVDMKDFQPTDEVKIRMLTKGGADEK